MIAPVEKPSNHMVGAILVIGGGIAGIQASLDLAESGQKVYLLERAPAIGGNMARLDKTFPTNDCAMCILSPKIVECGRHLNIETITWSELEELTGSAGRFRARIRRKARYIDIEKCTGCGDCAEVCPIECDAEFEAALDKRKAVFRPCPQAYPNAFVIDKHGHSPCRIACPGGININAYVALTAAGRFEEALDVVQRAVPLPGVLGRVCDHACESACHLKSFSEPVSICAIKRFLSDRRRAQGGRSGADKPEQTQNLARVAIVGSGPAGLAAAWELVQKGYRPTIFEGRSRAGGMLAWGIPDYRLPQEILDQEIQDILDAGVNLQLNTRIGEDLTLGRLRQRGFRAVVLAIGAHAGAPLNVPGEELAGVTDSIAFLRKANSGLPAETGQRVAVVGGGNSAVDAARTALRLGAREVTIVYRRSRPEMPAIPAEVTAAEQEGIKIHFLAAPLRLKGRSGRVRALECLQMRLGAPDASGRSRPIPIPGSEFQIRADMVISAIGQKVILPERGAMTELRKTRWGTIDADSETAETSLDGVFAVGDAVTGPSSVIQAIAGGKKAAQAVDCFLRGAPFEPLPRMKPEDVVDKPPAPDDVKSMVLRQQQAETVLAERVTSFAEVEHAFTEEQALAEAQRCLHCADCCECMACVEACRAQAVVHSDEDALESLDVGAVVVMPGFEEFVSRLQYDYGFRCHEDVVSSMQFERILSASGPFGGHVQRPSDRRTPKRIAFLQCVGSRDISCRNEYCSSVCCMYAIKEAVIAKEHMGEVDVTIFFMDIRAFGKDFDKYYERANSEYGVRFVRARVSDVTRAADSSLRLSYSPAAGGVANEDFDMVVLSVGLEPSANVDALAAKLGIRQRADGFIWTDPEMPLCTSRPGVFAAGVATGPKDIPETVVQASAAACEAGRLLAEVGGTLTKAPEYPPERDTAAESPRIGAFICHCGINIGGVVDVPSLAEYAKGLTNVVYATDNLYTCSQDTQAQIRDIILEENLNRVVIASCSPRTHERLFQETLRQAGLNPNLIIMTNIRDQCSWAHMHEPAAAADKACDLVRMAVAKARLAIPLGASTVPVIRSGLVVGGGLAGLHATLAIADHGYDVTLVERDSELGGNARELHTGFDGQDLQSMLARTVRRVMEHPRITVRTGMTVTEVTGFVGNFKSTLADATTLEHGVAVLATGAAEYRPTEYLYGRDERVITQRELQTILAQPELAGEPPPRRVVMIQCVGSRNDEHPYCSRVCCTRAVKNAILIKERHAATEVLILYRDIRTYGYREQAYQKARELGVQFIHFDKGAEPQVHPGDPLRVELRDPILQADLSLDTDLLVLSAGIVADREEADRLGKLFKVPINDDGFFLEAHVKLRPVEFATEGVFLAGLAHAPKSIDESISQALAAASRACTILQKTEIEAQATVAEVQPQRCVACGLCEAVCPYGAANLELQRLGREERIFARVNSTLCKGCGACVAGCRSGALNLRGFTDQQILAEILEL